MYSGIKICLHNANEMSVKDYPVYSLYNVLALHLIHTGVLRYIETGCCFCDIEM